MEEFEVYENDIEMYLHMYLEENELTRKDLNKEVTQNQWNAILAYIYRHLFRGTDLLFIENTTPSKAFLNRIYNDDLIYKLCEYYIQLCNMYDKEISIMGFSNLTGISRDTIYSWGIQETRASDLCSYVSKKLSENNEESLSNMLISGKRNPVGILGVLNHHHGWNMPGVKQENSQKPALSVENLPKLEEKPDSVQE